MMPIWFRPWMAWAAAVTALLLALAWQHSALSKERAAHAGTKTAWAEDRVEWSKAVVAAAEGARIEERRRYAEADEIAKEANAQKEQALADLDQSKRVADRLRAEVARLLKTLERRTASDTPAIQRSQSTTEAADLLAYVQQRLDEAADGIAGFADQSYIAADTCGRQYQSLTTPADGGLAK